MAARTAETTPATDADSGVNDLRLVGHVRRAPVERTLPSGDVVVGLTVRAGRPARAVGPRGTGDTLDVTCWTPATRRAALRLEPGDLVEIDGAVRRSVRSGPGGILSRWEVEVFRLRRVARA